MKAVSKLAVLISLGVLATFASAKTDEETYLEKCSKDPAMPVPLTVVAPSVRSEYDGATVQLEFTVDAAGKTADFSVKSSADNVLAEAVLDAVKQWRFKPAEVDGKPVAKKVLLPVKIVDDSVDGTRYATN